MFDSVKCTQKCDICGDEYTYEVPYMEPDPAIFKGSYCGGRFHLYGANLGKSNDILNICPRCDTEIGNLLERLTKGKDNLSKCPFCGRNDEIFFMELNGTEHTRTAICRHCDATIYKRRSDGVWEYTFYDPPGYDGAEVHLSRIRKHYPASDIHAKRSSVKGWNVYTVDIKGEAQ
ncbi:MAG: hypothetical protein HDT43_00820 [Ruminococcaceae bacterium]|nr:hypothetical protein [Oscillospiraceae bacterium]